MSVSGTMIQGISAIGRNSPEVWPSMLSAIGDSAYARPAASRVPGVPMTIREASRTAPPNAAISKAASHSRCVTQPGTVSSRASSKNGPIGNR